MAVVVVVVRRLCTGNFETGATNAILEGYIGARTSKDSRERRLRHTKSRFGFRSPSRPLIGRKFQKSYGVRT